MLRWLRRLAEQRRKRIPVRLVKGAYWDSEIKWAQERGLADYPVFTRKVAHRRVLSRLRAPAAGAIRPRSIRSSPPTTPSRSPPSHRRRRTGAFEFQRLHGMGEALYEEVVGEGRLGAPCRIYAPVGAHEDLVAYLVRRLLENGANTSFVNRLADEAAPIEEIVARSGRERWSARASAAGARLPRPPEIFCPSASTAPAWR